MDFPDWQDQCAADAFAESLTWLLCSELQLHEETRASLMRACAENVALKAELDRLSEALPQTPAALPGQPSQLEHKHAIAEQGAGGVGAARERPGSHLPPGPVARICVPSSKAAQQNKPVQTQGSARLTGKWPAAVKGGSSPSTTHQSLPWEQRAAAEGLDPLVDASQPGSCASGKENLLSWALRGAEKGTSGTSAAASESPLSEVQASKTAGEMPYNIGSSAAAAVHQSAHAPQSRPAIEPLQDERAGPAREPRRATPPCLWAQILLPVSSRQTRAGTLPESLEQCTQARSHQGARHTATALQKSSLALRRPGAVRRVRTWQPAAAASRRSTRGDGQG